MEPLLAKAVGNDKELESRVLNMFQQQTTMPKANFSDGKKSAQASPPKDEVEFCLGIATEQLPLFKK